MVDAEEVGNGKLKRETGTYAEPIRRGTNVDTSVAAARSTSSVNHRLAR